MLKNLYKIIVVDNEEEQIKLIKDRFENINLPAFYSIYNPMNVPDEPFTGIRLAFFDIKLHAGDDTNSIQTIYSFINALKSYISIDNGPYILIFWSTHTDLIDLIKRTIEDREKQNVPHPMLIKSIDKTVVSTSEDLEEAIRDAVSNEYFDLLFTYENTISKAAGLTLQTIFEVISGRSSWGDNEPFETNFNTIFSKIASNTLGFEHAKQNPDKAIYQALSPILSCHIDRIAKSDIWKNKLVPLRDAKRESEIILNDQYKNSLLNSIYHIDSTSKFDLMTRGGVFQLNFYDFAPSEFKSEYFFSLSTYYKDLQSYISAHFFRLTDKIDKDLKERVIGESKFVAIEISTSCDHSQNKNRNNKYLLGLLTPFFDTKRFLDKESINDALLYKELPAFIFNENESLLWINFRFVFSDLVVPPRIQTPLFILKKELMDLIGNRYANHISRIGITTF